MTESGEITKILQAADFNGSFEKLLPFVYDELRKLAQVLFQREYRENHTLQPTALVHEAYIKMTAGGGSISWQNRAHFFGIAANSMRQILVNHAKAHGREKRGGGRTLISLDESMNFRVNQDLDVLALNEALETLSELDARQAKIVELRFFGGLTLDETAAVLKISTATVSREWEMARTWLYLQLRPNPSSTVN